MLPPVTRARRTPSPGFLEEPGGPERLFRKKVWRIRSAVTCSADGSLSGTQAQSVPGGLRGLRSLGAGQFLPRMPSRLGTLTTLQDTCVGRDIRPLHQPRWVLGEGFFSDAASRATTGKISSPS
jgi:hypothetical protein